MMKAKLRLFALFFFVAGTSLAQTNEQVILAAMRRIGHEVLLGSHDSTSRVLPIRHDSGRYKISFSTAFRFDTGQLIHRIDTVMRETGIARSYLVEMEQRSTGEVVYSYAVRDSLQPDKIPCATRIPPKDRYTLFITLPDRITAVGPVATAAQEETLSGAGYALIALPVLVLFLGTLVYFRKKRSVSKREADDSDTIRIGNYRLDKKKMRLHYGNESTELSGKETDLLILLHAHENVTLAREAILKAVWDDEGDYIGRTLDVFVSKLRKKLEADPGVRIVNIRGVGYRLMVN